MKPIFCFGELLLRLSPTAGGGWLIDAQLPVYLGGAELNVAMALAQWKQPVKYATSLPPNSLSDDILALLQARQIDTTAVHLSGQRIGIYYLPQGKDLKNASVIYDRAHSSFSSLQVGMIDWDQVLEGVGWFHFSAISPAVSASAAAVCKEGLLAAAKLKIPVSIDLNYRARLWQYGKQPTDIMPELLEYCDGVMGNIWSANSLLGIPVQHDIGAQSAKADCAAHARATAQHLFQQYPNCRWMAQTFRFDMTPGIHYFATMDERDRQFVSASYKVPAVKDKVGSGDCFMAALIYGAHHAFAPDRQINFAAAAAIGKMNETGDSTRQTISSIENNMQ